MSGTLRILISCAFLLVLAGALGASSLVSRDAEDGAAAPTPDEPKAEDAKGVFVVYSVNVVGKIDVCGCKRKKVRQGSITRRASYLRNTKFLHPNLLPIDGGNTLFGPDDRKKEAHERQQTIEKAKVLVESYNRLDYGCLVIGNYDLLLGLSELQELAAMAQFPFLSANVVDAATGERIFPATAEIEVGGVKVGLLGLTLDTIPEYFLGLASPDRKLKILPSLETARGLVPGLRERCDLVFVLSNNDVNLNRQIAEEVPGIDFLVDPLIELGNHKLWIDDDKLLEKIGDTHIVRTDAQGARVGTLDIALGADGGPLVNLADGQPAAGRSYFWQERVSLEPHMLEDPEIAQIVENFRTKSQFIDTEKLPPLPHKDRYLTASACTACHVEQYVFWEGTKHADAFASLEVTNDQWRQDCIACHVVGYGQAFIAPEDAEPYKNVQCESCHGLSPKHPLDPANHSWPKIEEKTCLVCHNKEQTREDFQFFRVKSTVACPPMKKP